jgi:hypothetical protein
MTATSGKGGPALQWQTLATEFAITIANGEVWLSIGEALLFGGVVLLFGIWVARTVGLLRSDAPAGETLGVGLASGLLVLAAWWAALASGGRSSFTPAAVGFAIALALALVRRARRRPPANVLAAAAAESDGAETIPPRSPPRRSLIVAALAGAVFVVAIALLYGATMAPSPRDGVQPVEFTDEAFYAVLGRDLATTGTETNLLHSGFSDLPGLPSQTWYHWGELWLASAVITVFGTAPLAARFFVVLPVVLLAAAALTGTVVRRMARTSSRRAYLFGFVASLFLAPMPLPGPFFGSWAVSLIFGITLYGLASVAALLALYGLAVLVTRRPTWALAGFVGSAVALILPAHIVIVLLALVGTGSVWTIRIVQSVMAAHRLPIVSQIWRRTFIATGIAIVATVVWGLLTGHGMGTSGSPSVSPFNASWRDSVAITILGAGAFLAIPVAWLLVRKEAPVQADVYFGTVVLLVAGAIAWGARLGDITMFHVFYGGIAVFATPVAAVAVWMLLERLREKQHLRLAFGLVVVCVIQLELGVVTGILRLQQFGPHIDQEPISVSLLGAIRQLPPDARLAYACRPFDEAGFADPSLLSIDAHTGRRVVPMCFEANFFSTLLGAQRSVQVPNATFRWAPQRTLYPDAEADPSSAAVAAFLKDNGIDYIYADARHPNSLVADAVPIATSGEGQVFRIP